MIVIHWPLKGRGVAVGAGVGLGVAVGRRVGVGLGVAVGSGVGVGVAVGTGVGVGVAVGSSVGVGVAVGTGAGVGVAVGSGVDVVVDAAVGGIAVGSVSLTQAANTAGKDSKRMAASNAELERMRNTLGTPLQLRNRGFLPQSPQSGTH